jgi:hypothetical protein
MKLNETDGHLSLLQNWIEAVKSFIVETCYDCDHFWHHSFHFFCHFSCRFSQNIFFFFTDAPQNKLDCLSLAAGMSNIFERDLINEKILCGAVRNLEQMEWSHIVKSRNIIFYWTILRLIFWGLYFIKYKIFSFIRSRSKISPIPAAKDNRSSLFCGASVKEKISFNREFRWHFIHVRLGVSLVSLIPAWQINGSRLCTVLYSTWVGYWF